MIKELGASTYKANSALDSLAKTDDMLGIIGIIMLIGVLVTSYGAYWQGKYAQASYNNQCKCTKDDVVPLSFWAKNGKMIGAAIGLTLVILVLMAYVFKKKEGGEPAADTTATQNSAGA